MFISQYLDTPTTTTPKTLPGIKVQAKALKGCTRSYSIEIVKESSPLEQLDRTRPVISSKILLELEEQKGLKFVETLQIELYKQVNKEYSKKHILILSHILLLILLKLFRH